MGGAECVVVGVEFAEGELTKLRICGVGRSIVEKEGVGVRNMLD